MNDVKTFLVQEAALREYTNRILESQGLCAQDAAVVTDNLLFADLRGTATHGVMRLGDYVKRLELGLASVNETPEIVSQDAATAVIDGKNGLGPIAAKLAMEVAMEKARENTVGIAFVKNNQHYGACAYYTMMAMEQNMVGLSSTNTVALMAPTGGKKRVLGNNPISFAAPSHGMPFVLDIAMSNVAGGKIMLAQKNGQSIPLGWALDKNGQPTTDAYEGFQGGGLLLPVGAHKGYGIAMMLEILCGILSGGVTSSHVLGTTNFTAKGNMGTAHMMMAINVERLMPAEVFKSKMDAYIAEIKDCPCADGVEQILIPGELEYLEAQMRQINGIPLSQAVLEEVETLGVAAGLGVLPSYQR